MSYAIPIVTLGKVDPLDHLTEMPCPDENCNGIAVFLPEARFFRKQDEDPSLGPVDLGFETSAWQCQDCKLYLVTPETFKEMKSTKLEVVLAEK